jgi:hypothetical protein
MFSLFRIRTMDEVRKPINSVCYTPSSEPYRIYQPFSMTFMDSYKLQSVILKMVRWSCTKEGGWGKWSDGLKHTVTILDGFKKSALSVVRIEVEQQQVMETVHSSPLLKFLNCNWRFSVTKLRLVGLVGGYTQGSTHAHPFHKAARFASLLQSSST